MAIKVRPYKTTQPKEKEKTYQQISDDLGIPVEQLFGVASKSKTSLRVHVPLAGWVADRDTTLSSVVERLRKNHPEITVSDLKDWNDLDGAYVRRGTVLVYPASLETTGYLDRLKSYKQALIEKHGGHLSDYGSDPIYQVLLQVILDHENNTTTTMSTEFRQRLYRGLQTAARRGYTFDAVSSFQTLGKE